MDYNFIVRINKYLNILILFLNKIIIDYKLYLNIYVIINININRTLIIIFYDIISKKSEGK